MEKSSYMDMDTDTDTDTDMDMDMEMEDWEVLQVPIDSHTTTTFGLGLERGKEDLVLSKGTNFGPAAAFVDNHYFILPSRNQEVVERSMPEKLAREEEELESPVEFKDTDAVAELSTREDIVARIGPEPIYSGDEEEEEEEEEEEYVDHDAKEEEPCSREEEGCGLKKVWRWKLVGGVGALCSIGVAAAAAAAAAAAVCVLLLGGGGGRQQPSYETHSQTQRLPFQIYADEKRIKQVVQQASRLNQALTAARGVPTMTAATATATRANISFGGYYDGL